MKTTLIPESRPTTDKSRSALRREIDAHGICHLIFDAPDAAANLFTRETLRDLERQLREIAALPNLTGLLIRSGKPRIFVAGADLKTMLGADREEIAALISAGQRVFNALEALRLPKVAAIHGACLGGGFEMALACDYRIASDDKSTKIGLPETQLGLLPARGGSTRLPRLIGIRRAAAAILKGTAYTAFLAKKHGLVDEVVPSHCLQKHAIDWLLRPVTPQRRRRWDKLASPVIRLLMRRQLAKSTHGNYPALPLALDIICQAPWRDPVESMAAEKSAFLNLIEREGSRNLVKLFFARDAAKKLHLAGSAHPILRVAVVGAGVMGSGIAYWLSSRGFPVLLLDVNDAALAAADQRLASSFKAAMARHLMTKVEARAARDRIVLARNEVPLPKVDLVIEAAVENPEIKRRLFAELEGKVSAQTLLATNTSAIPLGGLMDRPQFVGLHFFNPVHAMPLVEIVRPATASDDAMATAVQFVQEIDRLPIVVRDSPGFLVNRVLMPYLLEAARMVHEGCAVASVDAAMLKFGMPMGPLRLLDEVGLDVALHVVKTLASAFPDRIAVPDWLSARVEEGLLGVKSKLGYYDHAKGRNPVPLDRKKPNQAEMDEAAARLPMLLSNEAARCLDDQVVDSPAMADLGMVLGTGYAPFRGGPLRHADSIGLREVVDSLSRLAAIHGPLYAPAAGMLRRADAGKKFHLED